MNEEPPLRRDSDEPPVIVLSQVRLQVVPYRVEQAHVWWVVLVPVRALVVVASGACVDEVVALVVATSDARPMMIDRQRRARVILVNTAVCAAL